MSKQKNRQKLVLMSLILVFLMPFAAAWVIYHFSEVGKDGGEGSNYGELLDAPVMVPDLKLLDPLTGIDSHSLYGKWNVLYLLAGDCAQECKRGLDLMLVLRNTLDKDAARIQTIAVSSGPEFEKSIREYLGKYSGKRILLLPYANADGLAGKRAVVNTGVLEPGKFYIIDPVGNLIMTYSADSDPDGLISDLKRLLRYSRIG